MIKITKDGKKEADTTKHFKIWSRTMNTGIRLIKETLGMVAGSSSYFAGENGLILWRDEEEPSCIICQFARQVATRRIFAGSFCLNIRAY